MALTVEQQARRRFKITASMLPILMHGDEAALLKLYCEEIGETEREPPTYAMQLGSHVEPFILDYWDAAHGTITRRGEVIDHPAIPEFCCTLDGYRAFDDAVIEVKFLSPFWHRDEFVMHYYPQVLAQMRCVGAKRGILLAGQGTGEPVEYDITPKIDDAIAAAYEREMWDRVYQFRLCLRTFTPPVPWKRVVPPEIWRTIDLTKEPMPNWGHAMLPTLDLYEDTREAAAIHEQAGKDARSLVPDDVSIVISHQHKLARDKRGVLRITRIAA
jgi:hypothetical protein